MGLRVLAGQDARTDTTTPASRLVLGIFAVLAEFEPEHIRERTLVGPEATAPGGVEQPSGQSGLKRLRSPLSYLTRGEVRRDAGNTARPRAQG